MLTGQVSIIDDDGFVSDDNSADETAEDVKLDVLTRFAGTGADTSHSKGENISTLFISRVFGFIQKHEMLEYLAIY